MAITSVDHPNIPEYGVYVRIEGLRSILTAGEHGEPPMFLRVGEKMVVRFTPEIHRLIDDGWAQLVDFLEEPSASQYFPTMRDVLDMIDQRATTLPGEYVVGARVEGDRLILMVGRDLATARDIPVDIPAFADMNGQVADAEAAATRAEDAEANIQSLVEQAAQDAADAVTSEAATYAGIASAAAEAALDHAERAEQATVDSQAVIDAAAQVSADVQSIDGVADTATTARDEAVDAAAVATAASVAASVWTGNGPPNGVETAPVGSVYVDQDATAGAVRWIKASGAGNTGWEVMWGDTGFRDISSLAVPGLVFTRAILRRENRTVTFFLDMKIEEFPTAGETAVQIPAGFTHLVTTYMPPPYAVTPGQGRMVAYGDGTMKLYDTVQTGESPKWFRYLWSWHTDDPWPTTLPPVQP